MQQIPLQKLLGMEDSVDTFNKISERISLNHKQLINKYLQANNIPLERMPPYSMSPYRGEATRNVKNRLAELTDCGRTYLVHFRVCGVFKTKKFIEVSYDILSSDGSDTKHIWEALKKFSSIHAYSSTTDGTVLDNYNFYATPHDSLSPKRAACIRKAFRELEGIVRTMPIEHRTPELFAQLDEFLDIFQKERFSFSKKSHLEAFQTALKEKSKPLCFYIGDKLVGFKLFHPEYLNTCSSHFSKTIANFSLQTLATYGDPKKLSRYLGLYINEVAKQHLFNRGFDALYIDGVFELEKKALKNKELQYKNKVTYKKIPNYARSQR